MKPVLDKHAATLALYLRSDNVDKFLEYYDTNLTNLTDSQVRDVKEKALAVSEYPESKFRSVLTSLFGKMPALLSDNLSSSSDSSYVSTVTELSTEVAPPPVVAAPPPVIITTNKQTSKKKAQRKRKKVSTPSPDKVILPPPPPPVLETPAASVTSASYADMLRKPQPLILSECSSETDLALSTPTSTASLSTLHSSCPNLAWEKCTTQQCKHSTQLEFLNESRIATESKLSDVISINQGDLQSVFDSSTTEKQPNRYLISSQTTLRSYTIHNHQSDTISDNHQKLINYFSKEWRKVSSNKEIRTR